MDCAFDAYYASPLNRAHLFGRQAERAFDEERYEEAVALHKRACQQLERFLTELPSHVVEPDSNVLTSLRLQVAHHRKQEVLIGLRIKQRAQRQQHLLKIESFQNVSMYSSGGFVKTPMDGSGGFVKKPMDGSGGFVKTPMDGSGGFVKTPMDGSGGFVKTPMDGSGGFVKTPMDGSGGFVKTPMDGSGGFVKTLMDGSGGFEKAPMDGSSGFEKATMDGSGGFVKTPMDGSGGFVKTPMDASGGFVTDMMEDSTDYVVKEKSGVEISSAKQDIKETKADEMTDSVMSTDSNVVKRDLSEAIDDLDLDT